MAQLNSEAHNQNLPSVPHPPQDCIECPLCNQPLIKTSEDERKAKETALIKLANQTQANYMGVARQHIEEDQVNRAPRAGQVELARNQ